MKDERNLLAVVIAKVAEELEPTFIVVENVPAFLTRKVLHPETGEPVTASSLLVSMLEADYVVFPILTDLAEYGVPQTRRRAFLTFVRKDHPCLKVLLDSNHAPFPNPTHETITLRGALARFDLPKLDAKSEETALSDVGGGLHSVPVYDDRRYDMVAAIPAYSGSSAWNNDTCLQCGTKVEDENAATCPACSAVLPRPVFKEKDGSFRLIKGFRSSSYRRLRPDQPAATITTGSGHLGSHFTIHPWENRLLSALECAYLQTLPPDFKWGNDEWHALEKWGHTNVREMIGEAVPPLYTELHGKVLSNLLAGKLDTPVLSHDDERCKRARKKLKLPEPRNLFAEV